MVEDGRKTRTSLAAMGEIKTTDQLTFRNTVLLGLEPSASFINGSAAVRISRMRRQQQDHLRTASKYIRNCVALTWEIVFICLFQYCSDLIIVLLYTTRLQPYSSHLNHLQHCIHIHYLKKIYILHRFGPRQCGGFQPCCRLSCVCRPTRLSHNQNSR